ncbi:MAG: hypothetical protein COA42_24030 [Alteromonadaceae bacterium]|nr:MAG: hypothetical protein COA42_24030 [Alteromonadaceae bacterium]
MIVFFAPQCKMKKLLVEHQSTPDKMMPFRVLQYLVGFLNTRLKSSGDKRLPAVYGLHLRRNTQVRGSKGTASKSKAQ